MVETIWSPRWNMRHRLPRGWLPAATNIWDRTYMSGVVARYVYVWRWKVSLASFLSLYLAWSLECIQISFLLKYGSENGCKKWKISMARKTAGWPLRLLEKEKKEKKSDNSGGSVPLSPFPFHIFRSFFLFFFAFHLFSWSMAFLTSGARPTTKI